MSDDTEFTYTMVDMVFPGTPCMVVECGVCRQLGLHPR